MPAQKERERERKAAAGVQWQAREEALLCMIARID
jgi:hypothetical protein